MTDQLIDVEADGAVADFQERMASLDALKASGDMLGKLLDTLDRYGLAVGQPLAHIEIYSDGSGHVENGGDETLDGGFSTPQQAIDWMESEIKSKTGQAGENEVPWP